MNLFRILHKDALTDKEVERKYASNFEYHEIQMKMKLCHLILFYK